MGEVYRASDPRLGREVALKVLRRSRADAESVARFSREARAAGSLNHPNIVAVFDVGTEGGVPFVVTELLQGETLRARLDRGPLPYRKAVDYGVQIAQALDAAHGKGIWHRDVKPANTFITDDGRVKLLDFGIAKLTERGAWTDSEHSTVETSRTGEIRGTAGYMSPEQVLGGSVDHRTDIFALGAVLYEMFTGARAFHRASTVETMTAVLQEDPADLLTVHSHLPPAAAALVRRCLEKNKEERFQSARDLAFDLQQLRELTGTTGRLVAPAGVRRFKVLPAILAVALLAQGIALVMLLSRRVSAPDFEQLTFRRERIGGARFASGSQGVVHSATGDGNELHVWYLPLSDTPGSLPVRLSAANSNVLAARAGDFALLLRPRFVMGERFVGTLALAPISGGSPRPWLEHIEDADWDPSGVNLAVAHSSGDAGGESRLEYPPGTSLYTTEGSIRFVRFSRDGRRIAFIEDPLGRGVSGTVAVVDLAGKHTTLTKPWESVRGLAWSPSGNEIWYTAGSHRSNRSLHAVNLEGEQRVVLEAPGSLTVWDVAPDGRVLLTRDDERKAIVGLPPGATSERDLSWLDDSGVAALSVDGRSLLFGDRSRIYLRSTTDGSPPIDLGLEDAFADDLSPDGRMVVATAGGGPQLILVPTGPGDPRPLPTHGITGHSGARWFPDGHRIMFAGREERRLLRSYVQSVDGGLPRPVTEEGTWGLSISPNGAQIAAIGSRQGISLWPVTDGPSSPRHVPESKPDDRPVAWSADGKSLWIFRRGEVPAEVYRLEIETGRRQRWKTLVPPDVAGAYSIVDFRITPTGSAYVYSYTRLLSQLYLVRGLK
jgi:dipeptidyl aminopeptidase/acylaminoacyl peptidase